MGLIHLHSDLYQSVFYHVRSGVEFTSYSTVHHLRSFRFGNTLDISFWNDFIFMQLLNNVNSKFHPDLVIEIWKRNWLLFSTPHTKYQRVISILKLVISIVLYPKWFRLRLTSLPAMVSENHLGDSLWYCLCGIISITRNEVGGSTHRGWHQPLFRDPRLSKRLHSGLWVYAPVPVTSLPSRTDYKRGL